MRLCFSSFFFFNDTATTEIYTLSLHDALPISSALVEDGQAFYENYLKAALEPDHCGEFVAVEPIAARYFVGDRKSTRLNSSHSQISYAVFCLKKKKK